MTEYQFRQRFVPLKISLLTPHLSNNALGRAYTFARILQRRHRVEIIGPAIGTVAETLMQELPMKKYSRQFGAWGCKVSRQMLTCHRWLDVMEALNFLDSIELLLF